MGRIGLPQPRERQFMDAGVRLVAEKLLVRWHRRHQKCTD